MPDTKTGPNFLFVTNKEMNQQVSQLAHEIKARKHSDIDYIVCINRGGMYVARLLSDLLKLPILAIGIRSYKGPDDQDELQLFQDIEVDLVDKTVLLVDEICDSGATFDFAKKHLSDKGAKGVISCCLYTKPHSTFTPDHQGQETTDWVVFPYEIRETYDAIQPFLPGNPDLQHRLSEYLDGIGVDQHHLATMSN